MPYLRVSPGGMRVPSGKMTIHSPSASRALPCSSTSRTAAGPPLRLTAIARSWRMPQPTNGIQVSSRLSTHTCGGSSSACATVSQLEECLISAM